MRKILFPIFLLIIFLFPVLGEDLQKEDNQDYAQLAVSNLDYMVTVGLFIAFLIPCPEVLSVTKLW